MNLLEEYYKELYERLSKENEHVIRLLFEKEQEIVELRNENKWLKDQIAGKPMADREKILLRVARQIIKELEK
ncbi:hypothetical protein NST41_33330 [Paenibacillus sp. FSL L8-0696]|uniref:hypothetical protein n=1 Tax=Paenibacillus TaxID=44249 RepID=UPI0004B56413|nr:MULTISPECIES: hypothetical protein [Paenibacillus]